MSKIKIIAGSLLLATVLFAETKVVSLSTGWNLVGNLDMNITELRTATSNTVTDVAAPGFSFKKAFVAAFGEYDGTYQTFQKFEGGKGYWVKMSESKDVTYTVPTYSESKTMSLNNGWNLVSGFNDMNITELRTAANDSITDVAAPGFSFKKAFVSAFGEYDGTYQTFQKFEESKGYWIKIDSTSESVTFSSTTIEQPPETPSLDDNTTSGLSTPPSVPGV